MKRKQYSWAVSAIFVIGVLFFLRDEISVKEILDVKTWKGENPHMLWWAIVSFVVMLAAKSWRFLVFYQKAVKKKIPSLDTFRLFNLFYFSYALSYLVAGVGVVTKIIMLKKEDNVPATTSTSLIVAEKIFSLAVILPVILYFANLFYHNQHDSAPALDYLWLISFLVLCLTVCLFYRQNIIFWCFAMTKWLPKKWKKSAKKAIVYANMGFSLIDNPLSLVFCLALTLAIWLGEAGLLYSFLHFHGVDFTFSQSIIFFFIVFMHTIVPITGSFLTFEVGFLHAAKLLGFTGSIMPIAILTHLGLYALYLGALLITAMISYVIKMRKK